MTHLRPVDAFDLYAAVEWDACCDAVRKLKVELREGEVIPLRSQSGDVEVRGGGVEAELDAVGAQRRTPATSEGCGRQEWRGVRDSNPWPPA